VFITSTVYTGNLGGLSGADAKCQERAEAACEGGLDHMCKKTFRAWLSVYPNIHARERIKCSNYKKYVMWNSDEWKFITIADNCSDLIDGGLDHPINYDEWGKPIPWDFAWTGTNRLGTAAEAHRDCKGWTFGQVGALAVVGMTRTRTYGWTEGREYYCDYLYVLYCFEI
jgi:hypothetical protein